MPCPSPTCVLCVDTKGTLEKSRRFVRRLESQAPGAANRRWGWGFSSLRRLSAAEVLTTGVPKLLEAFPATFFSGDLCLSVTIHPRDVSEPEDQLRPRSRTNQSAVSLELSSLSVITAYGRCH